MNTTHRTAAAALTALALLGLAGCGTPHTAPAPKRTVTLSNDLDMNHPVRLPATTLTLRVHESFAVRHLVGDQPRRWVQTTPGSTVLHRAAPVTASPCPSGNVGCSITVDDIYTAEKPGTTTVVWSFAPMGGCGGEPAPPACRKIPKTIEVTVLP